MRWGAWKVPVLGGTFGLAFALNPAFVSGCGLFGPSFEFGEADVVALMANESLLGPHRFRQGDAEYVLTVELEQRRGKDQTSQVAAVVREAHACSGRTFLRSAGACLDTTDMPVEGRVKLVKLGSPEIAIADVPASGSLEIHGLELDNARLDLEGEGYSFELRSTDARRFELARITLPSTEQGKSFYSN